MSPILYWKSTVTQLFNSISQWDWLMTREVFPEVSHLERGETSRHWDAEWFSDTHGRQGSRYLRDIVITGTVVAPHVPRMVVAMFQGKLLLLGSTEAVGVVIGSTTLKGKPHRFTQGDKKGRKSANSAIWNKFNYLRIEYVYTHTHACHEHVIFNVPYSQILREHCHLPNARMGYLTLRLNEEIANSLWTLQMV